MNWRPRLLLTAITLVLLLPLGFGQSFTLVGHGVVDARRPTWKGFWADGTWSTVSPYQYNRIELQLASDSTFSTPRAWQATIPAQTRQAANPPGGTTWTQGGGNMEVMPANMTTNYFGITGDLYGTDRLSNLPQTVKLLSADSAVP